MKITFKIHIFFFISLFICFITGHFKDIIIFTLIVIIHEMGHISMGLLFKWPISKVMLLPFGCLTIFNQKLNASLTEEFLIAVAGPIFQILFFYLIDNNDFAIYHYSILLFNLIPIYPMDGAKMINIILNKLLPFRHSYLITLLLSLLLIFYLSIIIVNKFNLILLIIIAFLFNKVLYELINIKYINKQFILERYLYKIKYKRKKKIRNINNMYKEKTHKILVNKNLINEELYLAKMFDNR